MERKKAVNQKGMDMGFRFQKRIKILPGITANISKSGVSASVGTTGARVTYGHGKKRTTLGLPGTGISHTTVKSTKTDNHAPEVVKEGDPFDGIVTVLTILIVGAFLMFLFS